MLSYDMMTGVSRPSQDGLGGGTAGAALGIAGLEAEKRHAFACAPPKKCQAALKTGTVLTAS